MVHDAGTRGLHAATHEHVLVLVPGILLQYRSFCAKYEYAVCLWLRLRERQKKSLLVRQILYAVDTHCLPCPLLLDELHPQPHSSIECTWRGVMHDLHACRASQHSSMAASTCGWWEYIP